MRSRDQFDTRLFLSAYNAAGITGKVDSAILTDLNALAHYIFARARTAFGADYLIALNPKTTESGLIFPIDYEQTINAFGCMCAMGNMNRQLSRASSKIASSASSSSVMVLLG